MRKVYLCVDTLLKKNIRIWRRLESTLPHLVLVNALSFRHFKDKHNKVTVQIKSYKTFIPYYGIMLQPPIGGG